MQPITIRNATTGTEKTYKVPTEFHELTQDQFLGAVAIMQHTDERPELQWALIPLISGISMQDLDTLNELQRVVLLNQFNFLFDSDMLPFQAMITSFSTWQYRAVHCPRKIAKALSTTLYGPGDGLGNLTYGEFMAAELRLEKYNKNPGDNMQSLNEFCGILYRKSIGARNNMTDRRIHFQEAEIPSYGKVFQAVTQDVKAAIMLNYQGAKGIFPKLYRNLFPPHLQENDTEQPAAPVKKKSQSLTWLDMMYDLAALDLTKYPMIRSAALHETLNTLDKAIKQNLKMKEEAERLNRR